jgi:outer membrane protein TolC
MKQCILLLFILTQLQLYAREYSLKECIDYALVNNSTIKISAIDKSIAQGKIDEQTGAVFPQVTASGGVEDAVQKKSTLTNDYYTLSGTASLQQKIYDPVFFIGLKAAKINKEQSQLILDKTKEQTAYTVCLQYYQTLVIQKQYQVVSRITTSAKGTLDATKSKFENGSAKKIDVDKILVSYNNNLSRLRQINLNYEQSINNLKYQIGLPVDSILVLRDTLLTDSLMPRADSASEDSIENSIDYQLLKIAERLQYSTRDSYAAGYLPSVSLTAKYMYSSTPDKFTFNNSWDQYGSIGVNLSIPLFDGFQKRSKLSQANYEICKAKEKLSAEAQSIKIAISNYTKQYQIAADNLENEKANLTLSESVYKNTLVSFQQGAESSLELIQAESSMQEAQNNYFTTLLTCFNAYLDLAQSKGILMKYVASLK